jgi:hypothetical protein
MFIGNEEIVYDLVIVLLSLASVYARSIFAQKSGSEGEEKIRKQPIRAGDHGLPTKISPQRFRNPFSISADNTTELHRLEVSSVTENEPRKPHPECARCSS